MQIKVNGVTISVENSPVTTGNLALDTRDFATETKAMALASRESEDISKMFKLVNILGDVKSVESFGYKSTEGVGEKIGSTLKHIGGKIKELIKKLILTISNFVTKKVLVLQIKSVRERIIKWRDEEHITFVIPNAEIVKKFESRKAEVLSTIDEALKVKYGAFMGAENAVKNLKAIIEQLNHDKIKDGNSFDITQAIVFLADAERDMNTHTNGLKNCIPTLKSALSNLEKLEKSNEINEDQKKILEAARSVSSVVNKGISVVLAWVSCVTHLSKPASQTQKK